MIPSIRPVSRRRKNIVWLASYPKSGNTWMRLFLHAYLTDGTAGINEITGPGETGDLQKALYEDASPVPLDELRGAECFYLRSAALFRLACLPGDQLVKTHCCNGMAHGIELIPREFTAGAIYLIRDPRDVVVSYAHHMGCSVDERIEALSEPATMIFRDTRMQYLSTWSGHVKSWTENQPFPVLVARYEDMLEKPREVFRHVAHFITGKIDDELLGRSIEATRFARLQEQEGAESFGEKTEQQDRFFRSGTTGQWREALTAEQVERIERDHGETMEKFGYEAVSHLSRRRVHG